METHNKRLIGILLTISLILLLPLLAMQFTKEVNWALNDFVIAGGLLLGTALVAELIMRKVHKKEIRTVLIVVIIALLVLVWIEMAVGIFGTPIAGS